MFLFSRSSSRAFNALMQGRDTWGTINDEGLAVPFACNKVLESDLAKQFRKSEREWEGRACDGEPTPKDVAISTQPGAFARSRDETKKKKGDSRKRVNVNELTSSFSPSPLNAPLRARLVRAHHGHRRAGNMLARQMWRDLLLRTHDDYLLVSWIVLSLLH